MAHPCALPSTGVAAKASHVDLNIPEHAKLYDGVGKIKGPPASKQLFLGSRCAARVPLALGHFRHETVHMFRAAAAGPLLVHSESGPASIVQSPLVKHLQHSAAHSRERGIAGAPAWARQATFNQKP